MTRFLMPILAILFLGELKKLFGISYRQIFMRSVSVGLLRRMTRLAQVFIYLAAVADESLINDHRSPRYLIYAEQYLFALKL